MRLHVEEPGSRAEPVRCVDDAARLAIRVVHGGNNLPRPGCQVIAPDTGVVSVLLHHQAIAARVDVVGSKERHRHPRIGRVSVGQDRQAVHQLRIVLVHHHLEDAPVVGQSNRPTRASHQPSGGRIRYHPGPTRVGDVHHAGLALVGGNVLETKELENVVGVRPVLQGGLRSNPGCPVGDIVRYADEFALEALTRIEIQVVVGSVERIQRIDRDSVDTRHPERPQAAGICPHRRGVARYVLVELSGRSAEGVVGGEYHPLLVPPAGDHNRVLVVEPAHARYRLELPGYRVVSNDVACLALRGKRRVGSISGPCRHVDNVIRLLISEEERVRESMSAVGQECRAEPEEAGAGRNYDLALQERTGVAIEGDLGNRRVFKVGERGADGAAERRERHGGLLMGYVHFHGVTFTVNRSDPVRYAFEREPVNALAYGDDPQGGTRNRQRNERSLSGKPALTVSRGRRRQ